MTSIFRLVTALCCSLILLTTTSCEKKDDTVPTESIEQQLLTAKTWRMEEMTVNEKDQTPVVIYRRGTANNQDDYSLMRQTFKKDGSIHYIDQDGEAGTDARYQFLGNRMLRLSIEGLSTIVENVVIRENSFSYRLVHGSGYTQFTFTPAP